MAQILLLEMKSGNRTDVDCSSGTIPLAQLLLMEMEAGNRFNADSSSRDYPIGTDTTTGDEVR